MAIQACIPPELCAVHNFIHIHNTDEIHDFEPDLEDQNPGEFYGELTEGPAVREEKARAELRQDTIAQDMWESYVPRCSEPQDK